jgi:segregation and condensation protein A
MTYQVKLQDFEGPLDLLLHLIRKNELDIYNVPVAEIANQYIAYIGVMETLNLDGVGDFLVMAATLAYHKSKMLLPTPAEVEDDEEDEFESLESLRLRLIEYQRYKEAAHSLAERDLLNRDVFKIRLPTDGAGLEEEQPVLRATLFDLLDAFQRVIRQAPKEMLHEVVPERIRLVDRIVEVLDILMEKGSMPFEELFAGPATREVIIVTFLSILELVRLSLIRAYQFEPFGNVHLRVASGEEDQKQKLKEALTSRES